ncbi:hypothetical protein [Halorubrum sp. SD626R]|uniref:protein kinase domain-containing protein n=1 Tax=Halorubrum sp. SD626R TaxID=1419722 RepID=UPI000A83BE7E|nr:hypothetical protein [Halorubrum sp. SD626R]TKX81303.1 hypothetical protein EXE53_06235 [Halorubrum sp. SD626R]
MDRTDVTPDPDDLLETALTDPESFDAARTTRLVAQLEHDDPEVQRAASWALRFVVTETPSLVDACTSRFQRALRNPNARPVILRTLAVLAEHNQEAVADIIDGAVEAELIDDLVGQRIVAGYRPDELDSGGSVIADEGEETSSPVGTAGVETETEESESGPDRDSPATPGHPPDDFPMKPPRLDRPLSAYELDTSAGGYGGSAIESIRITEGGREFTATRRRAPRVGSIDDAAFQNAIDRWCRIDDHDAMARVVDYGTRPVPWLISEQGAPGSLIERDTPVSPMEAGWILLQVADALHYAHTAGVLHGGFWPGAITFVTAVGDPNAWLLPRVGDWGLRAVFEATTELLNVPRVYAAPEHVAPERYGAVDVTTDIYGLGVIGYELLTGRPPIHDDGTVRPVGDVVNRVPDGLSTVLTKSLKPAKMERYASAAAFKRDLMSEDNGA